jgi:glyoxylase-like metal-dependent hydrolase (beta-lactamase superfamily II)
MQQIANGVFVETDYEGVTVGAIVRENGIICIDAPTYPRDARHWAMRVRQLAPVPVQYVILTDHHGDRIMNTRWLDAPIISHQQAAEKLNSYDKRYPQPLLDSLLWRNPEYGRELVSSPVDKPAVSFTDKLTLVQNGLTLTVQHVAGPTSGSLWVILPEAGVLFSGDSVVADTHPLLSEANSSRWLDSLQELQQTIDAGYTIIPGRGRLCGPEGARCTTEYLWRVRDCVESHYRQERPREELSHYVAELLATFPLDGVPRDWMQRQIRLGLDRVYDEVRNTDLMRN